MFPAAEQDESVRSPGFLRVHYREKPRPRPAASPPIARRCARASDRLAASLLRRRSPEWFRQYWYSHVFVDLHARTEHGVLAWQMIVIAERCACACDRRVQCERYARFALRIATIAWVHPPAAMAVSPTRE